MPCALRHAVELKHTMDGQQTHGGQQKKKWMSHTQNANGSCSKTGKGEISKEKCRWEMRGIENGRGIEVMPASSPLTLKHINKASSDEHQAKNRSKPSLVISSHYACGETACSGRKLRGKTGREWRVLLTLPQSMLAKSCTVIVEGGALMEAIEEPSCWRLKGGNMSNAWREKNPDDALWRELFRKVRPGGRFGWASSSAGAARLGRQGERCSWHQQTHAHTFQGSHSGPYWLENRS